MRTHLLLVAFVLLYDSQSLAAQSAFPPPPNPPTARAARTTERPLIDGRLDDPAWLLATPVDGFRQVDPGQLAPAEQQTVVRLLFDDENLYVGARMHDSVGAKGLRVRDLRRDFNFEDGDQFGLIIDAFQDGRSGMAFFVNPAGAQRDLLSLDDQGRLQDLEWDSKWTVRTATSDSGWTAEMAIPWTTLRYPPGAGEWRINFLRLVRRSFSLSGWSSWPRSYSIYRLAYAGRLTDVSPPPPSTNLRLNPFVVSRAQRTERVGDTQAFIRGQVGFDLKWSPSPRAVLDLTVNTDFAQADADVQQINLSRFSVFFPERRQFFLESAGLFRVGGGGFGGEPFFSRRIGLDADGFPLPIDAGARLVSRGQQGNLGALVVRQRGTDAAPAATFGVARAIRNVGEQGRVGLLITGRFDEPLRARSGLTARDASQNLVVALDAFARPTQSSYIRPMVAVSHTPDGTSGVSAHVHGALQSNAGYFGWIQAYIGKGYDPQLGFIPRSDVILTSPAVTLDWRPAWRPKWIRTFDIGFTSSYYHRASDRKFQEGNTVFRPIAAVFSDGSEIELFVTPSNQRLETSFSPLPGVAVAPGAYDFVEQGVTFKPDLSRRVTASVTVASGGYFDGKRDRAQVGLRLAPSPHAALTVSYDGNRLRDIGPGQISKTAHLWYPELRLASSPRLQLTTLYQYNSVTRQGSWNSRMSWEFLPLSYAYFIYSDRTPLAIDPGSASLGSVRAERQLILKVTWLGQL